MGNEDEASRVLLHAAELSPEPPVALKYGGEIQMDRAAGPDAAVTTDLCKYADSHPKEATMQYYCGALLFRRDYAVEDKTNLTNILKRLNGAAERLPNEAGPHCQLGRNTGGWNSGPRRFANRKFVRGWIRTPPKRTIGSGRSIITRVNWRRLSRK